MQALTDVARFFLGLLGLTKESFFFTPLAYKKVWAFNPNNPKQQTVVIVVARALAS